MTLPTTSEPKAVAFTFLGTPIVCVNWHDFQGWEVRLRDPRWGRDPGDTSRPVPPTIGWVRGPIEWDNGQPQWEYTHANGKDSGMVTGENMALLSLLAIEQNEGRL